MIHLVSTKMLAKWLGLCTWKKMVLQVLLAVAVGGSLADEPELNWYVLFLLGGCVE